MNKWFKGSLLLGSLVSSFAFADFLPPDQAFQFEAVSVSHHQAELKWKIADGYYLYHDQIKVSDIQGPVKLSLPRPKEKDDPNFGMTQVHYQDVISNIPVKPNQEFKIQWQGCAESGLCYPIQRTTITTDSTGLFPAQQTTQAKKVLNLKEISAASNGVVNTRDAQENASPKTETQLISKDNNTVSDRKNFNATALERDKTEFGENNLISEDQSTLDANLSKENLNRPASFSGVWNNDQYFLNLLSQQSVWLNLFVFLGLGILLAFLPCSLPLIPILSGILVQNHRGYRAAVIAFIFVTGMAIVYALMGFIVSQLGYSFQRWFQSPIFISIFSLLFIIFALNLFGVFQISLPQGMLQRLDLWQQKQKGGTLIGAGLMGMISALIVGPCMSAPLAGALIFVSQMNQPLLGATYLFVLGIGIGLPLFIAAVFGTHFLPKPGVWMDRLKVCFGFVMLLVATYFARPLIPTSIYQILMGLLLLGFAVYLLWKMRPYVEQIVVKSIIILLSLGMMFLGMNYVQQGYTHSLVTQAKTLHTWHKVKSTAQLSNVLNANQGKAVVIDVYADWCVACQPIEKEVLPREDVQAQLNELVLIKLDLTHFEPSQDELLKKWQILGPPTFIFLNTQHDEIRDLRLTGTFTATQLLNRLQEQSVGMVQ